MIGKTHKLTTAKLAAGAAALLLLCGGIAVAQAPAGAAKQPAAKGAAGAKKPAISEEEKNNMIAMVNDRLKHRFAPAIKSVDFGPAAVGKPVKVTVKAAYEDKRAIDKIVAAEVYYSIDDGKTFIGPVKLNAAGAGTFSGSIPGIKKAGKALVYPRVKDSFGNVAVDLPCKVSSWPPLGDGCMAGGAVDQEPVDDPIAKIENNFDIWDLRVGMDDKYFYINQNVEGKIDKGRMNPPHINMYMSMVVDTKELNEFNDATMLMNPDQKTKDKYKSKAGLALPVIYAPLASSAMGGMMAAQEDQKKKEGAEAGKPGEKSEAPGAETDQKTAQPQKPAQPTKIPSCFVPRLSSGKAEMDAKIVTCKADGPDLFIRLDRSIMPAGMKDSFSLLGTLNGFIDNFQTPMPTIREITGITRVTNKPHSFVVK
jgi:hypothetical protein